MTNPFIWLILTALDIYMWFVIIGVIMSWLVSFQIVNTQNRFVYLVGDFLNRITEPALRPIRRYMPRLGGLDISPLVLIILLVFAQRFVVWGYSQLG
ncbi:MAG: YggT family protein [Proteobacteria bacterium]|nr:YggT family protein [Pseudomonadota bacterium]